MIIIDADAPVLSDLIQKSLPETFTIKSGRGFHYYYLCQDLQQKIILQKDGQSFWAGLNAAENIQLFESDEKSFYRYDDERGLYSVISEDVLKQEISKRILEVSRKNQLPSLEKKRTISILNNILAHLKGISEKKHAFSYHKKDFIHLKNGVLKIQDDKTIDLVSFSPEFCSRNQSLIAFQADAKCDRFINELLLPPVSQEDAVLIQKYAGLCLLGGHRYHSQFKASCTP